MINRRSTYILSTGALIILATLFSCTDQCEETREVVTYKPVYIDLDTYNQEVKTVAPREVVLPGVINRYGHYLFINEWNQGIHVIDNADPAHPITTQFIEINNNKHFSIKDGILYANRYDALVAVDIHDLNEVKEVNRIPQVFFDEAQVTEQGILSHYELVGTRETGACGNNFGWMSDGTLFFSEFSSTNAPDFISTADVRNVMDGIPSQGTSVGSSTARFSIIDDKLLVLTSNELNAYSISNVSDIQLVGSSSIVDAETIFPMGEYIFVGGQSGMSINKLNENGTLSYISDYAHSRSCDPVVANDGFAYVTLRSGNTCQGYTNQLDVLDIHDIFNPKLVNTHILTNPRGLTLLGSKLYVCDGPVGVRVFDLTDPRGTASGIFDKLHANDILPVNSDVLVVSGEDGIYQLDVSDRDHPAFLSIIAN